jgi:hypothetical protein
MNILILYNSSQTFTNTVYEHLASFAKYSEHCVFFCHADQTSELNVGLDLFDAVGIHFTIRLPFDQVSAGVSHALTEYKGLKFLFIQDEYDHPKKAWQWIHKLDIKLVFTVVPSAGIDTVYPRQEFPSTRFVSNLTGYVPEILPPTSDLPKPSQRLLMVGYRGRPLPIRYGQLGMEKVAVGSIVKTYCDSREISNDIAWSEESRIYGQQWYDFVIACRSMLGSESGSNVFDWDGTLADEIAEYAKVHPDSSNADVYRDLILSKELDGLMNQLSPRVFEAIASRTVLVLFEGAYSGAITPWEHFIPLKKDGSNLDEVFQKLADNDFIDWLADNAYSHVIASGNYSYRSFVQFFDTEIKNGCATLPKGEATHGPVDAAGQVGDLRPSAITTQPIRCPPPIRFSILSTLIDSLPGPAFIKRIAGFVWGLLPERQRDRLRPLLKQLLKRH